MASTASAEYEGTSGSFNTSTIKLLPPVEIQRYDPGHQ
jgi:hypothetical protein